MKNNKMPAWLKKVKENQAEKSKIIGFERLKNRIEASADSHNPAIIMDIWEEVEKLNFKDFENLKNSLSEEGREFLENVILK